MSAFPREFASVRVDIGEWSTEAKRIIDSDWWKGTDNVPENVLLPEGMELQWGLEETKVATSQQLLEVAIEKELTKYEEVNGSLEVVVSAPAEISKKVMEKAAVPSFAALAKATSGQHLASIAEQPKKMRRDLNVAPKWTGPHIRTVVVESTAQDNSETVDEEKKVGSGDIDNDNAAREDDDDDDDDDDDGVGNVKDEPDEGEEVEGETDKLEDVAGEAGKTEQIHQLAEPHVTVGDVLVSVAVLDPMRETKSQEWLVAGSQSLLALRNAIYCLEDVVEEDAASKGSMMWIDGVLYGDDTAANGADYVTPIMTWLLNSTEENAHKEDEWLHRTRAGSMSETMFGSLNIRLHSPYLYIHHGVCEHILLFTDVRTATHDDVAPLSMYPRIVYRSKVRRKKCSICQVYPARQVTYNDRLAPSNPCFFCDSCFDPLHKDEKGQLLYNDFEVYPYFHE